MVIEGRGGYGGKGLLWGGGEGRIDGLEGEIMRSIG